LSVLKDSIHLCHSWGRLVITSIMDMTSLSTEEEMRLVG